MFTKQHFEKVAKIISNIPQESVRAMMAVDFCELFAESNSRFNQTLFLKACKGKVVSK